MQNRFTWWVGLEISSHFDRTLVKLKIRKKQRLYSYHLFAEDGDCWPWFVIFRIYSEFTPKFIPLACLQLFGHLVAIQARKIKIIVLLGLVLIRIIVLEIRLRILPCYVLSCKLCGVRASLFRPSNICLCECPVESPFCHCTHKKLISFCTTKIYWISISSQKPVVAKHFVFLLGPYQGLYMLMQLKCLLPSCGPIRAPDHLGSHRLLYHLHMACKSYNNFILYKSLWSIWVHGLNWGKMAV